MTIVIPSALLGLAAKDVLMRIKKERRSFRTPGTELTRKDQLEDSHIGDTAACAGASRDVLDQLHTMRAIWGACI